MQITLSKREIEVLSLISYGLTSAEIAQRLYISGHTVISHRKNLINKMRVQNTAGLVRQGFEEGILSISSIQKI